MIEHNIEEEKARYREASEKLLIWYQTYGRVLPWRVKNPDPYRVWLSEIMLQQTTVTAVKPYYARFLALWPNVEALAKASEEEILQEWAGLGYYSRARNLYKCAKEIIKQGGFPQTYQELKQLPGIGDYTASAIASIVYNEPVLALDGNVKRVLSRFDQIDEPIEQQSHAMNRAQQGFQQGNRTGDIAQAFMDLASRNCKAKNPICSDCPLKAYCHACKNQKTGEYPKRRPKPPKKQWIGRAFAFQNNQNEICLIKRPENGPLAQMWALPSSDWGEMHIDPAPDPSKWQYIGTVTHVFTHIHLELEIWSSFTEDIPIGGEWFPLSKEVCSNLPKLWQKALELLPKLDDK